MFTFKVTPDGGEEFEVTAHSRDIRMWEKTGPNRSFAKLTSDLKMTSLYEVAHIAARRQQLYTGTLDDFGATCDLTMAGGIGLEAEYDDAEETDPTRPVP